MHIMISDHNSFYNDLKIPFIPEYDSYIFEKYVPIYFVNTAI